MVSRLLAPGREALDRSDFEYLVLALDATKGEETQRVELASSGKSLRRAAAQMHFEDKDLSALGERHDPRGSMEIHSDVARPGELGFDPCGGRCEG